MLAQVGDHDLSVLDAGPHHGDLRAAIGAKRHQMDRPCAGVERGFDLGGEDVLSDSGRGSV